MSTLAALFLGMEKGSILKYFGILLCFVAVIARLIYDLHFSNLYAKDGDQFRGKYFILMNVFFLSAGVFFQKKAIQHNPNISLMVLIFYIFGVGFLMNVVVYQFKFAGSRLLEDSAILTDEDWDVYFSFDYIRTLFGIMTIYMMLILMEAYRYIALIYINKKGQISKVTIFGALHGFFVVVIVMVFQNTSTFDNIFVGIITFAYFLLFISKYFQARGGKKSTAGKILRFKRIFKRDEEAKKLVGSSEVKYKDNYYQSHAEPASINNENGTSSKFFKPR